ncbi:signal-regulatory protein beta-2-like [Micropterus salmoides]|uniref:signal-regulatory protein beta-2-like n=1 Tax=Micropterus salmoides TaxID=27706 RepID=UPI0018EB4F04|nr:signal-regulatory protein beta-2-like [Micropterus salmoides]
MFSFHSDALVPVTTVQLGDSATFTCVLPNEELSSRKLHWYKQRAGDTLKLIMTLWKSAKPEYAPEFSELRLKVNTAKNISNLTILRTIQEDEGMYHCAITAWINPEWSGTYLLVKGDTQRTSNYTVIQGTTVSDPDRPGDSITVQCSVLSDSDNKTCPGDHSVYWFRAGSDKSHPDIIYTDGNGRDECDKRSDSQKSCVYRFSKNVSSSDAGTYYCAVATCGEIFFGEGTKVDIHGAIWSQKASAILILLCAVLAISLIVIAFLIYGMKTSKFDCSNAAVVLQKNCFSLKSQQRDEDTWIYSAVVFGMMKADCAIKDAKAAERERIYAAVKAFGLD